VYARGKWGLYLAAEGLKDDGWRYQSPSRPARFYGDLGWKGTDAEIHLVTSAADNYIGVVGPTPVDLPDKDYRAIYTVCGDNPANPCPRHRGPSAIVGRSSLSMWSMPGLNKKP
jgi:hypothetical protein